jgi:glycosyltransferase involved in cell wall biosynthesis
MHVLLATNQATAFVRGGVHTQVLQTKDALEQCGVHVSLFEMWKEFSPADFDLVHLFAANMGTYHLARTLKASGLPMVISPVFYTRRTPRVVRSIIKADAWLNRLTRGVWTDYGLIAEMCTWAEAIFPNTGDEANLFMQAFGVPSEHVSIVPNGVEERFAFAKPELAEREFGVKDFILSVGHIGPERKNMLCLIEALEQIDHPSVIIGRVDKTPAGQACLERAKQNSNLLIVDALSHNSMLLASAYSACSVFALPSQFETPGIAALEAALAGAKIVITPFGGTKEYFENDAVYVDPYSSNNIADGIRTALKKSATPKLANRIKQEFIWKRVGEKTKQLYERVLSKQL